MQYRMIPQVHRALGVLACITLLYASRAHADFSGYYQPANWSLSVLSDSALVDPNQPTPPVPASTDATGAPGTVIIKAEQGNMWSGSAAFYLIPAPADGTLEFDWEYVADVPYDSSAGYAVNPVFWPPVLWQQYDPPQNHSGCTLLSGNENGVGHVSIPVVAGDLIGFWVHNAFYNAPAEMRISSLLAPAPVGPIHTIASSAGPGGTVSPVGTVVVPEGQNRTFTITPALHYRIADVLVDGVSNPGAVSARSYTFLNVTDDSHSIAVSFAALPQYTIVTSAGAGGAVAPAGTTSVYEGDSLTVRITPLFGCAIADVLVDGVSNPGAVAAGSYTFSAVTGNHTLSATFSGTPYFGLVWHYDCEGNVQDSAPLGSHNNGTVNGTVNYVTGPPNSKNPGNAVEMTWSGGRVNLSNTRSCRGPEGFSVAFWVRMTPDPLTLPSGGYNLQLIENGNYGAGDPGNFFTEYKPEQSPPGIWFGYADNYNGFRMQLDPDWVHVAFVYDARAGLERTRCYTNGVECGTVSGVIPDRGGPYWTTFGGNGGGDASYDNWLVAMDDVRFYNVRLTPAQVADLAGVPPPPQFNWTGTANADWTNPANWNDTVPGIGNVAVFSDTPAARQTVQLDNDVTLKGLEFNNAVAGTVLASTAGKTLTLDNGTALAGILTAGGSQTISAGLSAPSGFEKSGPGTLTVSGIGTDWGANLADNKVAVEVTGTGSELILAGNMTLPDKRDFSVDRGGQLTISGTVASSGHDQIVNTGTILLKGSGSWTVTSGAGFGWVGVGSSGHGVLTVEDNALLDCTELAIGLWISGTTGVVNQNGGTVYAHMTDDEILSWWGPELVVGPWYDDQPAHGEYHLNAGLLHCGLIAYQGGTPGIGSGVFYFNGGKLQINRDDPVGEVATAAGQTAYMQHLTHVYVGASGAVIDIAGHTSSIDQVLEHDPAVAGLDGGLSVMDSVGGGTLLLLRAGTYTGPLTIASGTAVNLAYTGTQIISSLKVAGVYRPAGVYGASASNPGGVFTGPGTVTVVPPSPVLPPAGFTGAPGSPTLKWQTAGGFHYRVLYSDIVSAPVSTWLPVITPAFPAPNGWSSAVSDGTDMSLVDPSPSLTKRFYRIQVQ